MDNKRILIIDDELEIWKVYQSILSPKHEPIDSSGQKMVRLLEEIKGLSSRVTPKFHLRFASQGEEGYGLVQVSLAQNMPYALVFIDVRMPPGWDGVRTAKQIHLIDRNIEIVIVTAYSDYFLEKIVQEVGTPDKLLFLKKPFDLEEVAQLALSLTGKWNLARQQELQRNELERQVEVRTAYLTEAYEKLQEGASERKREKDRYRKTIEISIDGFLLLDTSALILNVNDSYCTMIGYSRDELLGMTIMDVEALMSPEEIEKRIQVVIKNGSARFETNHRHKNGNILDVEVSTTYSPESGGEIFIFLRDITERKQAEQEKAKLESQLRQSQKMEAVGTMAAGIAHDFNNILNIIAGAVEYTKAIAPQDGQIFENMKIISDAGDRAASLVRQILTFSRQTEQIKQPLILQPLIKELVTARQQTIPASIEIRQKIDTECGAISADPAQMHQVVTNLVVNAVQAMEEHGGVLEVGLQEEVIGLENAPQADMKPGTYAHFWVSDTGHGMDQRTVEKIFDPYFTTKAKRDGVGLGLAIVYGILEEHNASVAVRSSVGSGTTFDVFFPIVEVKAPAEEKKETEAQVARGNGRILFVDDEKMNVSNWQMVLQERGYRVVGETDPLEALDKFKENPDGFDIVVTDQIMPDLSGLELACRLKEIRHDIPIVLITGWAESIDSELFNKYKIEIIHKPYRVEDFFSVIKKAIEKEQ